MISFRNLKPGKLELNHNAKIAIGAYDIGGDLIAICRDSTEKELKDAKN